MNDIELIGKYASEGKRPADIARIINRSPVFVNDHYRRLGFISERAQIIARQLALAKDGLRYCTACKQTKPFTAKHFYKKKSVCLPCAASITNQEYIRRTSNRTVERLFEYKLKRCQARIKQGVKCSLTIQDLSSQWQIQGGKCFYTGLALTPNVNQENTASVDRVDSSKNYEKGNIVWCCAAINYMKLDWSMDDFKSWCSKVHNHFA